MTLSDGVALLFETTCATSAAIVFVLLARQPLRSVFGANVAYTAWLLVPLAMAAVLLPARKVTISVAPQAVVASVADIAASPVTAVFDPTILLATLWLAGFCLFALWSLHQQRAFLHNLGRIDPIGGGLLQAENDVGLPAVIGLRGRIVLPADFEARYDARERELIITHERIHAARCDTVSNGVAALLCCLYWFNPLFWLAARYLRRDQELACDETVVVRHPQARRRYAEVMMKTQLSMFSGPVACHWPDRHPLKERLAMLKQPSPTIRRSLSGMAVVAALGGGLGFAAWAAQPPVKTVEPVSAGGTIYRPQVGGSTNAFATKPISISLKNVSFAEVAQAAAKLAGVRVVNTGILPQKKDATFDFKETQIATLMNIIADESGVAVSRVVDVYRFEPKKQGGKIAAAPRLVEPPVAGMTRTPLPAYPAGAAAKRQAGRVVLRILVAADGSAKDVLVEKSDPAGVFDASAVDAAKQWKFKPKMENGKAVAGWVIVPVDYDMRGDATTMPPPPPPPPAPLPEPPAPPSPPKPIALGAKGYEWIRFDEETKRVRKATCDVVIFDQETKARYCGIRKTV